MACFLHWKLHRLLPDGRPVFLWILSHLDLHFRFIRSYQIFAFSKDNSKRNYLPLPWASVWFCRQYRLWQYSALERLSLSPSRGRISLNFAALPALYYSSTYGPWPNSLSTFQTMVLTKHLRVYQGKTDKDRSIIPFCKREISDLLKTVGKLCLETSYTLLTSQPRAPVTAGSVSVPGEDFSSNSSKTWQQSSHLLLLLSHLFNAESHFRLVWLREIFVEFGVEDHFRLSGLRVVSVMYRLSPVKSCTPSIRHTPVALSCAPLLLLGKDCISGIWHVLQQDLRGGVQPHVWICYMGSLAKVSIEFLTSVHKWDCRLLWGGPCLSSVQLRNKECVTPEKGKGGVYFGEFPTGAEHWASWRCRHAGHFPDSRTVQMV